MSYCPEDGTEMVTKDKDQSSWPQWQDYLCPKCGVTWRYQEIGDSAGYVVMEECDASTEKNPAEDDAGGEETS